MSLPCSQSRGQCLCGCGMCWCLGSGRGPTWRPFSPLGGKLRGPSRRGVECAFVLVPVECRGRGGRGQRRGRGRGQHRGGGGASGGGGEGGASAGEGAGPAGGRGRVQRRGCHVQFETLLDAMRRPGACRCAAIRPAGWSQGVVMLWAEKGVTFAREGCRGGEGLALRREGWPGSGRGLRPGSLGAGASGSGEDRGPGTGAAGGGEQGLPPDGRVLPSRALLVRASQRHLGAPRLWPPARTPREAERSPGEEADPDCHAGTSDSPVCGRAAPQPVQTREAKDLPGLGRSHRARVFRTQRCFSV